MHATLKAGVKAKDSKNNFQWCFKNKKHNALHVTVIHVDANSLPFTLNMTKNGTTFSGKPI